MFHHWLLITISWLGSVCPQYVNSGSPGIDYIPDPLNADLQFPIPYYFNVNAPTTRNDYETPQNSLQTPYENPQADLLKLLARRTTQEAEETREKRWLPNQIDIDQNMILQDAEVASVDNNEVDENGTKLLDPKDKKYFSPWGGKRDKSFENMYTWKRATNIREPSMPKRVRFSPWGGKRSGQMVYKPGTKNSKIIFSTTIPELTRIVSNYLPGDGNDKFNFAGFQFIPSLDKRHPIKILALSTNTNERTLREALPFRNFLESLPKIFKPGHPYVDVQLKKDGKRKVKFSAWGGKRSPPIIGPIWTPAPQNLKETTLDTILLIRNSQDKNAPTSKAL